MEEERIEESSVRLVSSSGGGDGSAWWVDGSEVDSQSPPSSLLDENESIRDGHGSVRRRLAKKPTFNIYYASIEFLIEISSGACVLGV